jgi:O-antigen/teichoic acid export membrane protein
MVGAGDAGSKLLAFVATTLMVRLATPEQMAVLTLFVSVQTILLQVTDLGLGVSLVKHLAACPPSSAEERGLLRTVLTARALLVLGVGVPVLVAGSWLATRVLHRPLYTDPLHFAALAIVGGGMLAFAVSFLQARRRFRALSMIRLGEGAGRLLFLLGLVVVAGFSVRGVLWIQVLVPILVGTAGLLLLPSGVLARGSSGAEVRALFGLSRWILVATVVQMLAFQADTILLAALADKEQLGVYGAGLRLSSPLQLLAGVLGTVFFPEAMQHRTPEEARRFFRRTLRLTAPLGALGLAGAWIAGVFVERIFPQYAGLRTVFLLLSAGLASFTVLAAGPGIVLALDHAGWVATIAVGQFAVAVAGNCLLVPRLGAVGAALTIGSTWVITAVFYALLIWRLSRPGGPRPGGLSDRGTSATNGTGPIDVPLLP